MRTRPAVRGLQYLALLGYLVFLVFPLAWLVSTAFKTPQEIAEIHPHWIPRNPTLRNFSDAFDLQPILHAAGNSLVVAVSASVITVLLATPAAYAVARHRSAVSKGALGWVLLSQIFPFILIVIPLFLVLKQFDLINSLPGLVLVYVVWNMPFALWMLRSYVRAVPPALEEAAAVDGAGRVRTLISVVFPLLAPGVVATTLFAFINSWNEFFFALVLLKTPEKLTLPLVLIRFIGADGVASLGPLAAASVLATVPSLLFFAFIQRRLSSGMLSGAVKG
ncbi:carbohydrate ABC transporter permease [Peterkaempfera sp. SMS 1(5)a]